MVAQRGGSGWLRGDMQGGSVLRSLRLRSGTEGEEQVPESESHADAPTPQGLIPTSFSAPDKSRIPHLPFGRVAMVPWEGSMELSSLQT